MLTNNFNFNRKRSRTGRKQKKRTNKHYFTLRTCHPYLYIVCWYIGIDIVHFSFSSFFSQFWMSLNVSVDNCFNWNVWRFVAIQKSWVSCCRKFLCFLLLLFLFSFRCWLMVRLDQRFSKCIPRNFKKKKSST